MERVTSFLDKREDLFRKWRNDAEVFVETGTQHGAGIRAALCAGFLRVFSFEKNPELAEAAANNFADVPQVTIIHAATPCEQFDRLVAELDQPALFWLDAHRMDGNGTGLADYPLRGEVDAICRYAQAPHTILCDDLRLFPRYGTGASALLLQLTRKTTWRYYLDLDTSKASFKNDVAVYYTKGEAS